MLAPEVQVFVCFSLRLAVSKIQGRQKSEMHRATSNWTWTLNGQKYPMHTKYSPPSPKFGSVSLYDQRFQRYQTFYNSPLTTMLNVPKMNKKMPKIQYLKFHKSLSNFGRNHPQEYAWFWGVNMARTFSEEMSFEIFTPIWSYVNENENKIVKNLKF